MDVKDKICVVTGAASGIGRALCVAFKDAGAAEVVCVDRNGDGAAETAEMVGGAAYTVDVAREDQIKDMIDSVERDIGPIDLFWSNAGIAVGGGMDTPNDAWQRVWDVNVMSHVWAAVGLAEWIAMTHGDEGIKVSVLCPQAVRTEMTRGHEDHVAAINGMMEPEPVAQICLQAIQDETFLILPHPEVREYMKNKTDDYDRWIGGMRKLNRKFGSMDM